MTRELHWERLAGPEVAALARETNVAVLPVGCMEMHGPHLPTGTDAYHAMELCDRAVAIEPAVVLPPIWYNVNDQMQGYPGTIHIPIPVLREHYHCICLECARNGLERILFMVGHGGAQTPIDELQSRALEQRTRTGHWEYFPLQTFISSLMADEIKELNFHPYDGHGGSLEASWMLAARPDLVHLERVTEPGPVRERAVPHTRPRVPWIRQVPFGYTCDPREATAEKGDKMLSAAARRLAEVIAKLKIFDPEKDH